MSAKRLGDDVDLLHMDPVPPGRRHFADEAEADQFVANLERDPSDPFGLRRALPQDALDAGTDLCDLREEDVRRAAARALVAGSLVAREHRAPGGGRTGHQPRLPRPDPGPQPEQPGPRPKPKAPFHVTLTYVDHIAPGAEDPKPLLRWSITDPDLVITSGRLELYRSFVSAEVPFWTKSLSPAELEPGDHDLPWDGEIGAHADFPQGHVSVEFSPYRWRIVVTDATSGTSAGRVAASSPVAFRVDAVRLELDWGDESMLAQERDRRLLAELQVRPLTAPQRLIVPLLSNAFPLRQDDLNDATGGLAFEAFRRTWEDGPKLPLVASVFFADSRNREVLAPKGWGRRRVMWDFDYVDLNGAVAGRAGAYVTAAADYQKDASHPPGTACHVARKGKRSVEGTGYFGPTSINPVVPPSARTWGLMSVPAPSGPWQGRTAVLFQPARQAGDGYLVSARFDARIDLDVADIPAPDAALERKTGTIEVWRRIQVGALLKKRSTTIPTAPMQIGTAGAARNAFMDLQVVDPMYRVLDGDEYDRHMKAVLRDTATAPWTLRGAANLEANQYDGPWAVTMRTYSEWLAVTGAPNGGPTAEWVYIVLCSDNAVRLLQLIAPRYATATGVTLMQFEGLHNLEARLPILATELRYPPPFKGEGVTCFTGDAERVAICLDSRDPRTLAHELGHALFLPHAPGGGADARLPQLHDPQDPCLMSYDFSTNHFCGLCNLRLRGWDPSALA